MYRPIFYLICVYLFSSAFPSKGFVITESLKNESQSNELETTTSPNPDGGCPPDFYGLRGTSWCYHVGGITSKKTFNNADKACNDLMPKSRLASIISNADYQFVTTLVAELKTPAWIGLKLENDRIHWVDESPRNFSENGENDQHSTNKSCGIVQTKTKVAGEWDLAICSLELPYVCGYEKDPTVVPKHPHYKCGEDYLGFRSSCYRLVSTPENWFDSEERCSSEGGHLLRIEDRYEEAFMEVLFDSGNHTEIWIGLSDISDEYTFAWSDGWPVIYTRWKSGQPDLSNSCVVYQRGSSWITKECKVDLPFVCEFNRDAALHPVQKPIVPGKCPKNWLHMEEHCYLVEVEEIKSWPEAKSACEKENGHLASIHSKKENYFISRFIYREEVDIWIGLKRTGSGTLEWSDQSEVEYFAWASGSSRAKQEACTLAQSLDGEWMTTNCSTEHGYICKTKQVPLTITTKSSRQKVTPTTVTNSSFDTTDFITDDSTNFTTQEPMISNTSTTPSNERTTNSSGSSSSSQADSQSLGEGAIAGIVVGTVGVLVILVVLFLYLRWKLTPRSRPIMPANQSTPQRLENVSYNARSNSNSASS